MLPAIIAKRIQKTSKCWKWKGSVTLKGYGRMWLNAIKKTDYAHRIVYKLLVGPIATGMTIDHLCKNKQCVNPKHMEVVSMGVNVLRSDGPAAVNSRKTVCKNGHPFSGNNLTFHNRPGGHVKRVCRQCWNEYARNQRRKQTRSFRTE